MYAVSNKILTRLVKYKRIIKYKEDSMKTGIIVLNYNDADETIQFVHTLQSYQVVDQIVVIDNGSLDDSCDKLNQLDNIHFIRSAQNNGYAAGNNLGLKYLYDHDYDNLIIANPDIIIDKNNLEDFIAYMNSMKEYHVFGPTVKEHGTLNRGWKQRTIRYDIHDNYPLINRLFKKKIRYSDKHYNGYISEVDCVSGCFFGLKRELIDKIGFLDEGTFLYYEEDILSAKMKEADLKACILNHIEVTHNHAVTIDKNINRYRKLRILKDSQMYYHQRYTKHSQHQLNRLKRTANFACYIAYLRTNKDIVNVAKRDKKKVTIFALHLAVGGIEKAICSLANMLIDTYEVEIVCVYKRVDVIPFSLDKRVKVKYLSTDLKANKEELKYAIQNKKIISFIKESLKAVYVLYQKHKLIKWAAKDNDGDIIISSTLAFDRQLSKYQKNKLLIAWEHCHPDRSRNYPKQVQKAVHKFDLFIPSSKALYDYYKDILTGPQCLYLPLCIDDMPREKASLHTNQITVMGRLSSEKGYDDMLKVFQIILQQKPNVILNIVGDGEERHHLNMLAEKLDIKEHVIFHGNTVGEEKEKILLNTSVFVTTSHYESFGLVILEAMSYGIPCVSFDSAKGSLEIINHGKNGYIIKDRNFENMSNQIIDLLEDTSDDMVKHALKTAQKYSYQNVQQQWLDYFQHINIHDLKTRVIFTSSAGGHFSELCELKELMEKYNSFLISEDHEMMQDYKKINQSRSWYMPAGTKEHLFKFLCHFPINIFKSFKAYLKVRPDVVIATGAHTTVPICYIAHLFGKKVIFIETFANITTRTLSGKLVYPIADLFLVQWEELLELYPKAKYRGGLK